MLGKVLAFQSGDPGLIPAEVRDFISRLYWDWVCVSFVCVLSYVIFGGGPEILLTTDSGRSAFVQLCSSVVFWLPVQALDPFDFGSPDKLSSTWRAGGIGRWGSRGRERGGRGRRGRGGRGRRGNKRRRWWWRWWKRRKRRARMRKRRARRRGGGKEE